jgi:hypothetical protein
MLISFEQAIDELRRMIMNDAIDGLPIAEEHVVRYYDDEGNLCSVIVDKYLQPI